MSNELWQQAKQAMAEVMALDEDRRSNYLSDLHSKSPALHEEVVSLLAAHDASEMADFLANQAETLEAHDASDETMDAFQTGVYDPEQTREYVSVGDLGGGPARKGQPQDLVGDDYELDKKIGQGGMGVVYKAYHRSLRRTVALKIITGGGLRDEIDIARFHIEAEAAARLDHPGIIPVYDVGEHKGNHYYAMAYVEGPSLSEFVGKKAKLLKPRRAAELMEQVCRAVQFAHDRAVIHRDLKPANIMLENGEIPRLADFGLAKNMHEEDGLTMTGQVMGTPSYMAPEQASGKLDEISNRTDVYSLGATLYALLAGKPPFSGGTLLETIRQVVRSEPESLTLVSHQVPRDLQIICEKCLAKGPADRYASADEIADDLRRYLDGFPISARPLGLWARTVRICQRNPLEASLIGALATAIVVGSFFSVRYGLEANRALAEANQNRLQLRSAMKDSFVYASEDVLAQEPGMQAARAVLLNLAQQYYADLVKLKPTDDESKREFADSQFMLGKVQMALGEDSEARLTLAKALEIQKQFEAKSSKDAVMLTALAKTYNELATIAQKHWQRLTQLRKIETLSKTQSKEADQQLQLWKQNSAEVIRLRREVVQLQPADVESSRLLASAIMNEGISIGIRGFAKNNVDQQDQARRTILEAQEIRTAVLKDSPAETLMLRDLARGYFNMANNDLRIADQISIADFSLSAAEQELNNQERAKRLTLCVEDLTSAIEAYKKLPILSQELNLQQELADCYRLRGDCNQLLTHDALVIGDYQQAEKLLQVLTDRNPRVYRYRTALAETQFNFCMYWFALLEEERGAVQMARTRKTLLQALRMDPTNIDAVQQIVTFTQNLAEPLAAKKDFDMADRVLQEAIGELLAIQKESSEYAGLSPAIEILKAAARQVLDAREKAAKPTNVT